MLAERSVWTPACFARMKEAIAGVVYVAINVVAVCGIKSEGASPLSFGYQMEADDVG